MARRSPAYDSIRDRFDEIFEGAVEADDLTEAQGLLSADMAIVMRVSGTREKMKVQLALANLAGRQVVKRLTRQLPWMRRDKKVIEDLIGDLLKVPDIPVGVEGPEFRTETVFSKWWFWSLVGVVGVGTVAAVTLLGETETAQPKHALGTGGMIIKL